jgi:TolB-like protein/DNA-binding winged helix-turn-helix (wHTH) protein/Tfp pilus assembly protein PilF
LGPPGQARFDLDKSAGAQSLEAAFKFFSKSFESGMEASAKQSYCFGRFVLDPAEKVLLRDGHAVSLPPKALETLLVLVEKHGHVMDKAELLQRVWPDTFVEEATLAQNIFTLRKALDDSPDGPEYIETVPKRGYRFVAPVKTAKVQELHSTESQTSSRKALSRTLLWVVPALLIAILSAGIYFWARPHRIAPAPGPNKIMLAVLPFENLSGDPAQEYFSDGLTEEMIAQLSRFNPEQLRVIARTSAMQYKGVAKSVAQIGRELGVDYILESSFRREGNRVRITTQLVRVSDQTHLWSQQYERDATGVLKLQEEVAGDVAAQIALKLNPPVPERPVATSNSAAYEAYLRGRFFWNKRSEQGHLKAIEYFEQAIAADPDYAQAYSGLADAYALLGSNPTRAITRQEAMSRARAAALKALEMDETLAEAHTSLAFVYWHYDWNWPAAEKEFQRALQLNPSYPTAHHWYAFYLMSQGRTEQSLEEIRLAQETDPLSLIINTDAAQLLYFAQRYDQAVSQARRALEMDPDFSLARLILMWCLMHQKQYAAALDEAKKGSDTLDANPSLKAYVAIGYAVTGQKAKAQELLHQLQAAAESQHTGELSMAIAQIYGALGEKDEAFAWLEKDFQDRDGGLVLLKLMPFFDSLHSDPRFADLVRRIGLSPQEHL